MPPTNSSLTLTEVDGKLIVTQIDTIPPGGVLEGLELAVGTQVGIQKKKEQKTTDDDKPLAKEKMLQSIPWSAVFQFLGGEDVAKALMASKRQNPWKLELVKGDKGNEQQCIVSALKNRMMDTDYGKELLQKYYNNNPQLLPKLLYCMDRGYGIRYDGFYQCKCASFFHYHFLFCRSGQVRVAGIVIPDEIWSQPGSDCYEYQFLPTGKNLFQLKLNFPGLDVNPSGSIGPTGELTLWMGSRKVPRKFTFISNVAS